MVKITKNLIPLILLLVISINIFLMYITVNTYQYLKSEIERMQPVEITTINETEVEKDCPEPIICTFENVIALPKNE